MLTGMRDGPDAESKPCDMPSSPAICGLAYIPIRPPLASPTPSKRPIAAPESKLVVHRRLRPVEARIGHRRANRASRPRHRPALLEVRRLCHDLRALLLLLLHLATHLHHALRLIQR